MVVLKVLREFAGCTSIHGFGFLVSHKTSKRSKIIWAISIIVAMMYASAEMRNSVISKYQYLFQNHKIETNDYNLLTTIITWLGILGHSWASKTQKLFTLSRNSIFSKGQHKMAWNTTCWDTLVSYEMIFFKFWTWVLLLVQLSLDPGFLWGFLGGREGSGNIQTLFH